MLLFVTKSNKEMTEHRYILEPYKGLNTRFVCPGCSQRDKTFVRYIDTQTGEYLHTAVGRCNREVNCGYHYTPKQYFEENKHLIEAPTQYIKQKPNLSSQPKTVSFIPLNVFQQSRAAYNENQFVQFLVSLFGTELTTLLIQRYHIGTSKHWQGSTVFWQIDISGKVRTGKIIQYEIINEAKSLIGLNCKRVKVNKPPVQWAHKLLKVDDYNLNQCFFGEHLLQGNIKPVALFESEKTAVIASAYFPEHICLATGGKNGCKWTESTVAKVLQGRSLMLFPDISKPDAKANCFEDWSNKAKELSRLLHGTRFYVSDLLERNATESEREQGLDLADYLIRFDYRAFQEQEQPGSHEREFEQPQEIEGVQGFDLIEEINFTEPEPPKSETWAQDITVLKCYFEKANLPEREVKLTAYQTITNISKFIDGHLAIVKLNNGNPTFLPYLERLKELKQYITLNTD